MGKYWFKQKKYGYGAGLPIAWQGWVFLGAYLGGIALIIALVGDRPVWALAEIFALTAVFLYVGRAKTEGGWRWRWGDR